MGPDLSLAPFSSSYITMVTSCFALNRLWSSVVDAHCVLFRKFYIPYRIHVADVL